MGYARVSSTGQDLAVQLEKLAGCDKVFKEKRSGVDTGRPELKRCLEYLREGDTLLVTKIDRLARSTSDLYRIISELAEKGVAFKVVDDPTIDTTSRTGKLVMGILALIAEFENDIRRERQMDGTSAFFLGSLLGSVGYGIYCRSVRLSTLLHLSILAAIVSNAVYWQMGSLTSAYVVSVIAGAAYMTGTLIQLDLTARIIPARPRRQYSLPSWRLPILRDRGRKHSVDGCSRPRKHPTGARRRSGSWLR